MNEQELQLERAQAISRTAITGAIANLVMSVVKIGVGTIANSQALIADGIHSFSDLLTDILVWVAGRHSTQAPDQEHPYGHARYETLATLVLGIFLIVVALGIGWDAAGRLFAPDQLQQPSHWALYVAAGSILVNEWLFWYTLGYSKRVRSNMLRANAWHHRSDAVSSIVVLIGVAGTMVGLPYLDAIAAVLVAFMIAKIAWDLGLEAVQELVDTGLDAERLAQIKETILSVGGVRDVHMLRTRKHGGTASADVHLLVDSKVSVSEGHMISVLVEQRLKHQIDEITDVTVHIDPEDDEMAPPTVDLPLRTEAVAKLESLWTDISEAKHIERIQLHYLNGRISVDVFFPIDVCKGSCERIKGLSERLQSAAGKDPIFGNITAYVG